MPWPLRLVDSRDAVELEHGYIPVGACWFEPWRLEQSAARERLAPYYWEHNAHRPPLTVQMPGGVSFCVDEVATSGGGGWEVTGEPAQMTVAPSINILRIYHGWIQAGVISDDCEGRTFTDYHRGTGFP